MPERTELLKSMLQDLINNRQEQAALTSHEYMVSRFRDVAGLGQPQTDESDDENLEADIDDTDISDDESTNDEDVDSTDDSEDNE